MRNISFGQYYPADSIIHKLDPRAKVILAMLYIVASFVCKNVLGFALLILSAAVVMAVSRIPLKTIFRAIKPVLVIMFFTTLLNVFLVKEGVLVFSWWIINIYSKGIYAAISAMIRVMVLIIGSSIFLTYTTTPIQLTDGIEQLFGFLKVIKVSVHEFAMMTSIALRFIPTLVEETEKIISAQKARGADFTSGGLIKRAKTLVPILVPLFISAFRRADELAVAMECRCYRGGDGRTKLHVLKYRFSDFIMIFSGLVFLAGIILINYFEIDFSFVKSEWF
jgi:energy-coupling factor transport system permease protein